MGWPLPLRECKLPDMSILADLYSAAYGLVNAFLLRLIAPAEVMLVYIILETLIPRAARNSLGGYLRAARFWAVSIAINTTLFSLVHLWPLERADAALGNIYLTRVTGSEYFLLRVLGWIVAAYAAIVVADFFYYWLHRAQHRVPLLWRFHKVHHSITELSATSSYHHFTEDMMQFACVTLPAAVLLHFDTGYVPWLIIAIAANHAFFIHSSARINIGPLRYIFGDNRFHRIHHSREPHHFGKNFSTTFPLWDVLFGTAYFSSKNEWPQVGLRDTPVPKRVWDYLAMPFRSVGAADAVMVRR